MDSCKHPSEDRSRVYQIRAETYDRPLCEASEDVRSALVLFHHYHHWNGTCFVPGFTSSERMELPAHVTSAFDVILSEISRATSEPAAAPND